MLISVVFLTNLLQIFHKKGGGPAPLGPSPKSATGLCWIFRERKKKIWRFWQVFERATYGPEIGPITEPKYCTKYFVTMAKTILRTLNTRNESQAIPVASSENSGCSGEAKFEKRRQLYKTRIAWGSVGFGGTFVLFSSFCFIA